MLRRASQDNLRFLRSSRVFRALPPLLELADRTIANLEAKVRDSDARESSLLAQVADLQARLTHAEEQLAERDRWLAQLRSRERGWGSTRPSTPSE